MIILDSRTFTIPKAGNSSDENEDACEVKRISGNQRITEVLRCALSDGATQTSYSKLWAQILVEGAKQCDPSRRNLMEIIDQAQGRWDRDITARPLPWYAEEKAKKGAFATLLWLSVKYNKRSMDKKWKVVAIGDTNLFIFRDQSSPVVIPITQSDDFGNSPVLLSSLPARNASIDPFIVAVDGKWQLGDHFILATDALACYLLKECEAGKNPLLEIKQVLSESAHGQLAFDIWIQSLRQDMKIKNDDTTMAWVWSEEQLELIG